LIGRRRAAAVVAIVLIAAATAGAQDRFLTPYIIGAGEALRATETIDQNPAAGPIDNLNEVEQAALFFQALSRRTRKFACYFSMA